MKLIDTFRSKPHIRHRVKEVDNRGWVLTECGRRVIDFYDADNKSMWLEDGTVYARPCRICFPSGYVAPPHGRGFLASTEF